ncbi:glycoside hydrolase family 73 protein [Paenibacillus sedimenti]|uniref:Glucosaminidase domain-containing protein n=1 Tax=Paenibacillus sedimenti TaxID=2770274 RepID=A0A926KQF9_9BACL|nr:glucosaminidase domain-containing protein [Paenibacillus sedimenti]MBD0381271.1 glucosaminidase domain-containing protein [Paenibacillus sedimenti]
MKHAFIAVVAPIAVKLRKEGSHIFPSVRIAQALLETGGVLHPWKNLVGYKVGSGTPNAYWKGKSISTSTWEVYDGVRVDGVQANWRSYDSIEDCFCDQDLLFNRSRYERVRGAKTAQEQTLALYLCGYATDPAYSIKLQGLIRDFNLNKYDILEVEPMLDKGVAQTIINTWISPAWHDADDQDQKNYLHWLANELRKASGQPTE